MIKEDPDWYTYVKRFLQDKVCGSYCELNQKRTTEEHGESQPLNLTAANQSQWA